MKVVLLDDEQGSLEELAGQLAGRAEVVARFGDPLAAVEQIRELRPEAVFLDIEMPGMNGFAVAHEVLNYAPGTGIVFITAHSDFAIKAFEIDAVDYIVKPFTAERLESALRRLERRLAAGDPQRVKRAVYNQLLQARQERILLWHGGRAVLVAASKIACCYVAKSRRGVEVAADNTIFQCSDTFAEFLAKVGKRRLVQCHRSCAVNPARITELKPDKNSTMTARVAGYDGEIPVSRRYGPALKRLIGLSKRPGPFNAADPVKRE